MEPDYNVDRAKERLENYATEYALHGGDKAKILSAINRTDYKVIHVDQPRSWRLTLKGDESNEHGIEEEVFQVHGIICMQDLPPIKAKDLNNLKKKATFIRQAIRLTGLNTPMFNSTVEQVEKLFDMFNSSIDTTMYSPWQNAIYEGHKAIDISARYFTQRRNAPQERGQSFHKGVDPDNVLAHVRGQDLIHGNDNRVDYLSESKDIHGNAKLTRIDPSKFQIGDLIRATISFVTYPTKNKSAVMTIVLKALMHIETVGQKKGEGFEEQMIPKTTVIKRKVIFEEEEEAREGIAAMSISDSMKEGEDE